MEEEKKEENNLKKFAPMVLRFGIVFVFVWFGLNQLLNQTMWTALIPVWLTNMSGLSANTFVLINGVFEVVMAVLLAFGIQIRIVAMFLFLHLLTIVFDVGLSAIGIRDIGLMFALLSIALEGDE